MTVDSRLAFTDDNMVGEHPAGGEPARRLRGVVLRPGPALPAERRLRPLGQPAGAAPGHPAGDPGQAGRAGLHGARRALGDEATCTRTCRPRELYQLGQAATRIDPSKLRGLRGQRARTGPINGASIVFPDTALGPAARRRGPRRRDVRHRLLTPAPPSSTPRSGRDSVNSAGAGRGSVALDVYWALPSRTTLRPGGVGQHRDHDGADLHAAVRLLLDEELDASRHPGSRSAGSRRRWPGRTRPGTRR